MKAADYTLLCEVLQSLREQGEIVDSTDIAFKEKVELTAQIKYAVDTLNLILIRGRAEAEEGVIKEKITLKKLISFFYDHTRRD